MSDKLQEIRDTAAETSRSLFNAMINGTAPASYIDALNRLVREYHREEVRLQEEAAKAEARQQEALDLVNNSSRDELFQLLAMITDRFSTKGIVGEPGTRSDTALGNLVAITQDLDLTTRH